MKRSVAVLAAGVVFGCLALAASAPGIAVAVSAAPAASGVGAGTVPVAPLPKKPPVFDVQLWPGDGGSSIVVSARVATGAPLPVLIRMPLPVGANVDWVGEILGDTPEEDIRSPYRLVDDGGMLEMVLTTSRIAQYEATYVQPVRDGDTLVSTLEWTQSTPASGVRFAVKVTSGIGDVTVQPAPAHAPQFNASGDRLYVLDERRMKTGERAVITATYRPGAGAAGAVTAPAPAISPVLIALLALLGVTLAALFVVVRRQAAARRR
jgi:hypothetical protein